MKGITSPRPTGTFPRPNSISRIGAEDRRLDTAGHDTAESRRFLGLLRDTLEQMQIHRRMILERIALELAEEGRNISRRARRRSPPAVPASRSA